MKEELPNLVKMVKYYSPLLTRYAKMMVRNEKLADDFVKKVLEDQYDIDELEPSDYLREKLKTDLRALCINWHIQHYYLDDSNSHKNPCDG